MILDRASCGVNGLRTIKSLPARLVSDALARTVRAGETRLRIWVSSAGRSPNLRRDPLLAEEAPPEHHRFEPRAPEAVERVAGCARHGLPRTIQGRVEKDGMTSAHRELGQEPVERRIRVGGHGVVASGPVHVKNGRESLSALGSLVVT